MTFAVTRAAAIEVAGPSLGYDRGLKARICAKHGVRELWVINQTPA